MGTPVFLCAGSDPFFRRKIGSDPILISQRHALAPSTPYPLFEFRLSLPVKKGRHIGGYPAGVLRRPLFQERRNTFLCIR